MTYAIIILSIFVALLIRANSRRRKEFRSFEERLVAMHSRQASRLAERIENKAKELEKHFHTDLNELDKTSLKSDDKINGKVEALRRVMNELANKSGLEVAVEEVPIDAKPIINSLKGKLPDFMQEMMSHMDTSILAGIKEQKLVLRKKVATKKPKVK